MIYDSGEKGTTPISDSIDRPETEIGRICYQHLKKIEAVPGADPAAVHAVARSVSTVDKLAKNGNRNGLLASAVHRVYTTALAYLNRAEIDPLLAEHAGVSQEKHKSLVNRNNAHDYADPGIKAKPDTPYYNHLLGMVVLYSSTAMSRYGIEFRKLEDLGLTAVTDRLNRIRAAEENGLEPADDDFNYFHPNGKRDNSGKRISQFEIDIEEHAAALREEQRPIDLRKTRARMFAVPAGTIEISDVVIV